MTCRTFLTDSRYRHDGESRVRFLHFVLDDNAFYFPSMSYTCETLRLAVSGYYTDLNVLYDKSVKTDKIGRNTSNFCFTCSQTVNPLIYLF